MIGPYISISLLVEQFQEFLHCTSSINDIFDNQQIFAFKNIQIIHAYDLHISSRSKQNVNKQLNSKLLEDFEDASNQLTLKV